MFAPLLAAALSLTHPRAALIPTHALKAQPVAVVGPEISAEAPVQIGITLKLTHPAEMAALRAAQLNPASPQYKRWLTPVEFGQQFGQPLAFVNKTKAWLMAGGFEVTLYDNNSFMTAVGTEAQVKALLGVKLNSVVGARPSVHVPSGDAEVPAWLKSQLVYISGLDTRIKAHHRLYDSFGDLALGPQDIRNQYDIATLLQRGWYGQDQQLVVLAWAEAPGNEVQAADVNYFYQNVSNARAVFNEVKIFNPNDDFDDTDDGRVEFELDVEMQSVGSPGAASINLIDSPASAIFTQGAQYIAQNFPNATAVSTSIGECETDEASGSPGESATMEQAVIQGNMEGQTWSAAAGDNGADDCQTDGAGPISVDFPGVLPEVVSMGGSQIVPADFDSNTALENTPNIEEVWNDQELMPPGTDASGGGISTIFTSPAYQAGLGFTFRAVPDLAAIAGQPFTIAVSNQPGEFDPLEGTSIASPLSAGFFGVIASAIGCRLGDPHSVIYQLGAAQQAGGAAVFNDIVTGDNNVSGLTGFTAGPGYDSVSGWGSIDVYQLALAWPACPSDGGFETNNGGERGAAYSQCKFSGCSNNSGCVTINGGEGPSTCTVSTCDITLADAGNGSGGQCPLNTACLGSGPYAGDGDGGGACATGCVENTDCDAGGAGSCNACYGSCQNPGTPGATIGAPCSVDSDCGPGGSCLSETEGVLFDGGYCSANCNPFSDVCADVCNVNGSNGSCQPLGNDFYTCLQACTTNADCTREGYQCQPQSSYCGDAGSVFQDPSSGGPCPSVCEPGCSIVDAGPDFGIYNTCLNPWASCDPSTGVCTIVPGGGVVITNGTTGSVGTIGTTGTVGTTGTTATTSTGTGSTTGGATTGHTATTAAATGTTHGATGSTTGTHGTTGSAAAATATASTSSSGAATTSGGAIAAASGSSTGVGGSSGGCATGSGSTDLTFGLLGLGLLVWRRRRS